MCFEVLPDAFPEDLRADPVLEHVDYRSALAVRDVIERVCDVILRRDRLPDLARRHEAVALHRLLPLNGSVNLPVPIRPPHAQDLA
jgi:hypothetical protein